MTHLGLSNGCQVFIRCWVRATSVGLRNGFMWLLAVSASTVVAASVDVMVENFRCYDDFFPTSATSYNFLHHTRALSWGGVREG